MAGNLPFNDRYYLMKVEEEEGEIEAI